MALRENRVEIGNFALSLVLIAVLSLPVLAHAYAGWFTRYLADDYCFARDVQRQSFLTAQLKTYRGWSGRYAATFAITAASLLGPKAVGYFPLAALLLWLPVLFGAVYYSFQSSRLRIASHQALVFALLILTFVLQGTPNIQQSLYWITGMFSYTVPLILGTACWGLVVYGLLIVPNDVARRRLVFFSGLIPFLAGGFSETYLAMQTAILAVAILVLFALGRGSFREHTRLQLYVGLVASLLAMMVVLLAPGNSVRQQSDSIPLLPLLPLVVLSVRNTVLFLSRTLANVRMYLLFAVVVLPATLAWGLRPAQEVNGNGQTFNRRAQLLVLIPMAAFFVLLSCFAPAARHLNAYPPERALITAHFVLAIATVAWSYLAGLVLKPLWPTGTRAHNFLRSLMYALMALVAVLSAGATARRPLQEAARRKAYVLRWDQQDRRIREARARGVKQMEVEALGQTSGLKDIVAPDGSENWVSVCFAEYYGLESITGREISSDGPRPAADAAARQEGVTRRR